jgi:glycosyltransferase involved in cell wall biosynthesis
MKISVVVPTYNRNKIICETIQQILIQDYKNFELIVVDQTEDHDEYTSDYLSNLPLNAKLIKVAKPNLPAARNIGIRNSNGEIVVFFDDDLEIPSDTLSKLVSRYQKNENIDGLTGLILADGRPGEANLKFYKSVRIQKKDDTSNEKFFRVNKMLGGFMTFRKKVLDKSNGFDEWIGEDILASGEDYEFIDRLTQSGFKLFIDADIFVKHLGLSIIEGGCNKSKLSPEIIKFIQIRNNFYISYKHLTQPKFINSFIGFLVNYRRLIINKSFFKKSLIEYYDLHKIILKASAEAHLAAKKNELFIK